jgi:hypothetical protein
MLETIQRLDQPAIQRATIPSEPPVRPMDLRRIFKPAALKRFRFDRPARHGSPIEQLAWAEFFRPL